MASIVFPRSIPGTFSLLGTEPVATIISSASRVSSISLVISVFSLTSMFRSVSSLIYHSISFLSCFLKSGAAAAKNTPPNISLFSYRVTSWPRILHRRATSIPPMPPPMTAIFFFIEAGWRAIFSSFIVTGLSAQEPIRPKPQGLPLKWLMAKQPLWHAMHGRIFSSFPSRTLSHHCGSANNCLAMPIPSTAPLSIAHTAVSGSFIFPAQTTGIFTKCLI